MQVYTTVLPRVKLVHKDIRINRLCTNSFSCLNVMLRRYMYT